MTTIRPNLPPTVQPGTPAKPSEAARQAARAFFEIAAGKTSAAAPAAPVQASAPTAPTRAPAPVSRGAQAPAEAPARPLKPGSFLDIRV
jgi:hypothetical protein